MKKKLFFTVLIFLVVAIGCYFVVSKDEEDMKAEIANEAEIADKVTDECTEEYNNKIKEIAEVSSEEEKISPNCEMILKKYYKTCKHITNAYIEIPQEIINMTKKEIEEKYKDWQVEEFSKNKIILYKEIEGNCGEHYEIKADNNKVIVYTILDNGDKIIYEITGISVEYLTESDRNKLEEGIKVNGTENLNQTLEDFE